MGEGEFLVDGSAAEGRIDVHEGGWCMVGGTAGQRAKVA